MSRYQHDQKRPDNLNISWKKRWRIWWAEYHWIVIGITGIAIFFLGFFGFKQFYAKSGGHQTLADLIYQTIQLFWITSAVPPGPKPWALELSRFLATTITMIAAVKALMLLFRDKFQGFRLNRWKEHVVICGLGKKGKQLADDLIAQGEQVVIIESDDGNEEIDNCRECGGIVLAGDATSTYLLKKARAQHAKSVFAVCADDRINLEVALLAHKLMTEGKFHGRKWPNSSSCCNVPTESFLSNGHEAASPSRFCFVHLVDMELRDLLAKHQVFSRIGGQVGIKCFNIFENEARRLFKDNPPDVYARVMGQDIVHLLIIGFGQMGQSIALQAAKVGHYANGKHVRISVVDKFAEKKGNRFLHEYPMFGEICDITFNNLDIDDINFLNGSFLVELGGRDFVTQIIVCLEQETTGLVSGLHLMHLFKGTRCPLLIRVNVETELMGFLQNDTSSPNSNNENNQCIHAFGSIAGSCSSQMVLNEEQDRMDRIVHAAYVCVKLAKDKDSAKDASMLPWDDLSEDLKESNRQQTEHIEVKLRAIGCRKRPIPQSGPTDFTFTIEEIELLANMEHYRWNAERFLDGWTWTEGEKELGNKKSPYLVEWKDLSEKIKDYDRNTVREIPAVLAEIGEEIERIC